MNANESFRERLQQEYLQRCGRNSRYTLSAFARTLKTDVSTLGKIMKGQRKLGDLAIRRMAAQIGLSPLETVQYLAKKKSIQRIQPANFQQITADEFALISDWQHYAILELLHLNSFKSDVAWIAKALKISVTEAQISVERLQRLGLLTIELSGRWKDTSSGFTTTIHSNFSTVGFRRLQKQILEQAVDALESIPFEKRSQTSMTMAIDPSKLPEARTLIQEFRRNLNQLLSKDGSNTETYQLSVSLFPITNLEEKI